ncbi:hypothetical protein [Tateyamaria sp. SN3-11]|uniref:hypothetical protein n=1 Tax=Tateyamaria sp. SN3-11 TaxID=3092147 RepID=UPI0039EA5987
MTGDAPAGFVTGLLRRVSGQAKGVTPRIPSYFAGETAADGPEITEITQEVTPDQAAAPPPSSAASVSPNPTTPTQSMPTPKAEESEATQQPSEPRLFEPAPVPPPPSIIPAAASVETQDAHSNPPPVADDPFTPREPAPLVPQATQSKSPEQRETGAPPPQPTTPKLPNIAAEVAAAIASLRDDGVPVPEPRMMPVNDAPAPFDVPQKQTAIDGTQRGETEQHQPEPMHIHIGEIVIAPDPPSAATPPTPAASAPWAPNLTLDAYREARRKGAR